jgi:hypothetical protein
VAASGQSGTTGLLLDGVVPHCFKGQRLRSVVPLLVTAVANPLQRHAVVQRATPALCVTMEMRGPPRRQGTGRRAMRRVGGVEAPGSATNRRVVTRSDAAPSLKGRAGALCLNEDEGLPRRRRSGRRAVRRCVGGGNIAWICRDL